MISASKRAYPDSAMVPILECSFCQLCDIPWAQTLCPADDSSSSSDELDEAQTPTAPAPTATAITSSASAATVTILRGVSDCTAWGVRIGAVWARTLLWKLCNASCWDGCRVSGVLWYDHDGDAYFSLETDSDSVNFATNVTVWVLYFTRLRCVFLLYLTFSVFSNIINIQNNHYSHSLSWHVQKT